MEKDNEYITNNGRFKINEHLYYSTEDGATFQTNIEIVEDRQKEKEYIFIDGELVSPQPTLQAASDHE